MGIAVPLLLLFTVINCDTRTGGIFMKKRKLPHVLTVCCRTSFSGEWDEIRGDSLLWILSLLKII